MITVVGFVGDSGSGPRRAVAGHEAFLGGVASVSGCSSPLRANLGEASFKFIERCEGSAFGTDEQQPMTLKGCKSALYNPIQTTASMFHSRRLHKQYQVIVGINLK